MLPKAARFLRSAHPRHRSRALRLQCTVPLILLLAVVACEAGAQGASLSWAPFQLPFGSATAQAELAMLSLPENHSEPNGPRITLAVVRLAGTADRTRPPTIHLDGGPGGSAIGIARLPYFAELFTKLRAIGDVILVDQRGVGRSRPSPGCPPVGAPPADLFESEAKFRGYLRDGVRACAQHHRSAGVRLVITK